MKLKKSAKLKKKIENSTSKWVFKILKKYKSIFFNLFLVAHFERKWQKLDFNDFSSL